MQEIAIMSQRTSTSDLRAKLTDTRLTRRELMAGAAIAGTGLAVAAARRPGASMAQDASQLEGKLNYWHHFTSETEMRGFERVMAAFNEKYPKIEVVPEGIPNKDYMTKFSSAVLAGNLPNVARATVERMPDMVGLGGLVDLTDRVNNWELKDSFPDSTWSAATLDGKIYGIPAYSYVDWMYYRVDWFEEAGISKPPETWDEFREVALKLTDPSKGRFGFGLRGGDGGEGYIFDILEAFGSPIVDDQGCAAIDKDVATEAIRFFAGLYTEDKVVPPSAPNDSYGQIMEAFRTGQTGMVFHHTGSVREITDALGDKVMTAPFPAGPAGRIARVSPTFNGLAKADKEDAAWAWLTFWGDVETEVAFLEETGYFPANLQARENPQVAENPIYDAAIKTLEFGSLPPQFTGFSSWGKQTVMPAFQEVLVGAATPEQAVDEMIAGLKDATGC
jgi:multiple sugar transport system substrate-binding protein